MRVADDIKMRLDIKAEAHPCPDCNYAHFPSESDDEDKTLDVDNAAAEGGSPHFFDWLSGALRRK